MDKRFLDKVVDQIVNETTIDYDEERLYTPFTPARFHFLTLAPLSLSLSFTPFSHHCEEVYGLNKRETDYVWNEYKNIIKDKINNG